MPARFRLSAVLGAIALVLTACTGETGTSGPDTEPPTPTPTASEEAPARPDVAPEITTTGFVEGSNPGAWIFNEYGVGDLTEFDIPDDDVLCALGGDYAVTANEVNRIVRGWYLPTQERAWQLDDATCPTDGFVPQRLPQGAVLGTPTSDDQSAVFVDFATGETIVDIPVLDPESVTAPMPLGEAGGILILNLEGSLYGVNRSGKLMWELDSPGWTWSKNLMTGHAFGIDEGEDVMVVNGVTGNAVLETTVPKGRELTQTSDGFMYQEDSDDPYTFVTLDGTVSQLDPDFQGASHVPTSLSGALFPLNLYLSHNAGPIFDAEGNPASFDVDLETFHREGTDVEPVIVAVTADGEHAIVDDRGGTIYGVDQAGDMVWYLDALRPWVMESYIVVECGVGNDQILIPDFGATGADDSSLDAP